MLKESSFTDDLRYSPNEAHQPENNDERKRRIKQFGLTHPIQEPQKPIWVWYF